MALLAGTHYDPATAASVSTHALSAMTAIDTTNLRLTFTAPASGNVQVRIRSNMFGSTTMSQILLGVLESTTVIARQAPACGQMVNIATARCGMEATFVVTGVSGGSHTWDAAVAVQVVDGSAATVLEWGGPNNTTTNDAWGGFAFEIWDAPNLLGAKMYDPAVAVSKATSSLLAMTAFDTTNLRVTFTAPASGNVLVKLRGLTTGSGTVGYGLLGVLESATVVARAPVMTMKNYSTAALASTFLVAEAVVPIIGISGGSHTYDAAYGVEIAIASTNYKYGGPNDATGADAWGGFAFEVWAA